MSKINIGVTGTGSLIGQSIIKSITRSHRISDKINIIGFDYFKETVGSFWCNRNYILPDILDKQVSEIQYIEFLISIIKENRIRILFVGVDFELYIFSEYKDYIFSKTECVVMVSDKDVIEIADDKYKTFEFLVRNNLPAPESWVIETLPDNLNYPLIVKPRKGARSVGVQLVKNEFELNTAINHTHNPIIQEYIGTEETEFTCGIIYFENQLKHSIALNRSLKGGNTYISNYSKNTNFLVYEYISKISSALKPFGSCNFQLRISGDGTPKLFEINARHSGTTYIRSLFGYMEVEYICEYILNNNEIKFNTKDGKVVRYYDEFFLNK
jgi:carbamoyl-phosphate synthase large subunit